MYRSGELKQILGVYGKATLSSSSPTKGWVPQA